MSALLAVPLFLGLACLFGAGLLSGDCSVALAVSWLRLRHATGAAERTAGAASLAGAAFACTASGSGAALSMAGRAASGWADRAAVTLIPSLEGLLGG